MNVFHIIGPIMIGPSSSHTAGACRLGRVAYRVMNGETPKKVTFELAGSFATTYQGHGTDRALLAGLMGYDTDAIEIRDAFSIADERGIEYEYVKTHIPGCHPNTVRINFETVEGSKGQVQGASVGGGNIRIDSINGMKVSIDGQKPTILVSHKDVPGVIAKVTLMMSLKYSTANICNFGLNRQEKGGEALMTIELDDAPDPAMLEDIEEINEVTNVMMLDVI